MINQDPVITRAYAAEIAASNAVAAKRTYRRSSWPVSDPQLHAPALADVPHLLAPTRESDRPTDTVSRIATASLIYSLEKKSRGFADSLLSSAERERFGGEVVTLRKQLHRWNLLPAHGNDRCCYHCTLMHHALYDASSKATAPFVVNHAAHVVPSFDTDTNVAGAKIENYQVFVREDVARFMLEVAHPLRWHKAEPTLFKETSPATRSGSGEYEWNALRDDVREREIVDWDKTAKSKDGGYIHEDVVYPWSERFSAEVENIIKIHLAQNSVPTRRTWNGKDNPKLAYKYSLATCLRSDMGYGPEPGGLDVDDGEYSGEACHWEQLKDRPDLANNLQPRDLAHWNATLGDGKEIGADSHWHRRRKNDPQDPKVSTAKHDALCRLGQRLRAQWKQDPWLLTLTESKNTRYTAPGDTPPDLWAALTWLSPALLMAFLNRSISQPAHVRTLTQPKA